MDDTTLKAHHRALWKGLLYIQNHLTGALSLEEISGSSGYSPFHFHRIFRRFTGETVKAHIRRLRLEAAAFRLRVDREPVIDVALESGYYTHETFSRAFCHRFGANPSQYRKWLPSGTSAPHIEKVETIYFRERQCIFKRYTGPYAFSGLPEEKNSLWQRLAGYLPKKYRDIAERELFGISHDDPSITDSQHIRYDAGVAVPAEIAPTGLTTTLPAGFYARAVHRGPFDKLTDTYHYLIYHWCPGHRRRINPGISPFEQFHLKMVGDRLKTDHIAVYIPLLTH